MLYMSVSSLRRAGLRVCLTCAAAACYIAYFHFGYDSDSARPLYQ